MGITTLGPNFPHSVKEKQANFNTLESKHSFLSYLATHQVTLEAGELWVGLSFQRSLKFVKKENHLYYPLTIFPAYILKLKRNRKLIVGAMFYAKYKVLE